jgi:hypothetical protein
MMRVGDIILVAFMEYTNLPTKVYVTKYRNLLMFLCDQTKETVNISLLKPIRNEVNLKINMCTYLKNVERQCMLRFLSYYIKIVVTNY